MRVTIRCDLPSVFSMKSLESFPLLESPKSVLDALSFEYDPKEVRTNPPFVCRSLKDEVFFVIPSHSEGVKYYSSFSVPLRFLPPSVFPSFRDQVLSFMPLLIA